MSVRSLQNIIQWKKKVNIHNTKNQSTNCSYERRHLEIILRNIGCKSGTQQVSCVINIEDAILSPIPKVSRFRISVGQTFLVLTINI